MRLLWLADVLRAAGLTVEETDGWKTRGKDLHAVDGIVWHHTATGPGTSDANVTRLLINGRSDLRGPLAQLGLNRAGTFIVVTSGKANHNGYGLWGNDAIGIEAYNDGVGEPWPDAQVDAYVRGTRAIIDHLNLPISQVKGHKETDPNRKVDPRGLDMNEMRTRIQHADMEDVVTEEQMDLIGLAIKIHADRAVAATEAQTDQIDRYTVWEMRRTLKAEGYTDAEADAEISKVLGKKNLPKR